MKASALFKQYVWLVGTISQTGRITLREINDRWLRTEMSEGVPFSRTTFRCTTRKKSWRSATTMSISR